MVLSVRSKRARALAALKGASVQRGHNLCVIETLCLVDGLLHDLPYRERLHRIGSDSIGSATVLFDKGGDKVIVLIGLYRWPPLAVSDQDALGVFPPESGAKRGALIGT